jgi:hypothetical protein
MSEKIHIKPDIHQDEERRIREGIANGGDNGSLYERKGLESDPRVAEAMAYASKSLIEGALEDLNLPANEGVALLKTNDSEGYSKAPGVVTQTGHEVSYANIRREVARAHSKASELQSDYYDKVDAAQRALEEAKAKI